MSSIVFLLKMYTAEYFQRFDLYTKKVFILKNSCESAYKIFTGNQPNEEQWKYPYIQHHYLVHYMLQTTAS